MNSDEKYGWLKDLKVGDDVIVANCFSDHFTKVEHVTKTKITVGGRKFRVSDGYAVERGGGFVRSHLTKATPAKFAERKLNHKRRFLREFEWDNLADDLVEPIFNLINGKVKDGESND